MHNVSLDICVSDTSAARNLRLPGIGEKTFYIKKGRIFFLVQISVFLLLKIKERLRIRALS